MIQLKTFEKNYEGSIEEKFSAFMKNNPKYTVTHIAATDNSSQHGSRNKILYVVFETNEEVTL